MLNSKYAIASLLALTSHGALAGSWTLTDHVVSSAGSAAIVQLSGGSTNSCIPNEAAISVEDDSIEIALESPPPGTLCFSAFRPWNYTTTLQDLAAGSYNVNVLQGETQIGTFAFNWPLADGNTTIDPGFAPSEGMWWNSEAPGTGLAFNIDNLGRWFAALYVYNDEGKPTFLSMQGDRLTYNLDAHPNEPYAEGVSPLIYSEGGQCLACPWTQATVSDSGDVATLRFLTRTRAVLSVGDWSMDLIPMPETFESAAKVPMPILNRHYAMTIDGPQGQHAVVVKGGEMGPGSFTNQTGATLKCVDCSTVDANGASSDGVSAELKSLIESQIRFVCNEATCVVKLGDSTVTSFVDKTGEVITALIPGVPASVGATRIELRLLPQDWRN